MAITFTIDPTRRLVTLLYAGDPDFAGWQATMEAVLADPAYQPGMNFLADRRAVQAPPDREYLRSVTKYVNRLGDRARGTRWATLVSTPEAYGMVPLGQAFTEGDSIEVSVWTDAAAAVRWLCREEGDPAGGVG